MAYPARMWWLAVPFCDLHIRQPSPLAPCLERLLHHFLRITCPRRRASTSCWARMPWCRRTPHEAPERNNTIQTVSPVQETRSSQVRQFPPKFQWGPPQRSRRQQATVPYSGLSKRTKHRMEVHFIKSQDIISNSQLTETIYITMFVYHIFCSSYMCLYYHFFFLLLIISDISLRYIMLVRFVVISIAATLLAICFLRWSVLCVSSMVPTHSRFYTPV